MGSLRTVACLVYAAAFLLAVAAAALSPDDSPVLVARPAGSTTDPVAVIGPLPDTVSNGTRYYLDGYDSYDYADDLVSVSKSIANYTWEVTHNDSTELMYGSWVSYLFHALGLYEIKLTVADSWGNTGVNFTAVISVDDLDHDGMPDWWEMLYLGTMDEDANSDFDSDGYTNLFEWYAGTLPSVADPPPPSDDVLEEYWMYLVLFAVVIVVVALAVYLGTRKMRKEREAKKIEIAIELEKSLDEE